MNENTIAGYRMLRALNDDPQSHTTLVRANSPQAEDAVAELKVVKRSRHDVPLTRLLSEIECRVRSQGECVWPLEDIASAPDGSTVLVSPWQSVGSLRRLLRERPTLRAGEAITILAPLSTALSRIHRAGVALGSITIDSIHFDGSGRPFYSEWQQAKVRDGVSTPKEIQGDVEFMSDRAEFAVVACGVLAAIGAAREVEERARALAGWMSDAERCSDPDWELHWERRLFELGAPEPVRLNPERDPQPERAVSLSFENARSMSLEADGAATEWGAVFALPAGIHARVGEVVSQVSHGGKAILGAVATWCAPVRKRTWILAAAGALALSVATGLVLIDGADAGGHSDAENAAEHHETAAGEESAGAVADGVRDADAQDLADAEAADPTTHSGGLPDDPLDALTALLATRANCLRDLSVECLEAVARLDSPAFSADSSLVAATFRGEEIVADALFDPALAREVQRLGDSVLFEFETSTDTSKPASLLLVKGEAGWRIRSYTLPQ